MSRLCACLPQEGKVPSRALIFRQRLKACWSVSCPQHTSSPTQGHSQLPEETAADLEAGLTQAAFGSDSNLLLETYRVLIPDRMITVLYSAEVRAEGKEIQLQ